MVKQLEAGGLNILYSPMVVHGILWIVETTSTVAILAIPGCHCDPWLPMRLPTEKICTCASNEASNL